MPKVSFSFFGGLVAAVLLAAPAVWAQSTELVASAAGPTSSVEAGGSRPATNEASEVRHLSTPADEETTAAYFDDSHKDLTQTLSWMQETNALHPQYWSIYAEARIRLQLKDYAGAQIMAHEAKKLALAAIPANIDYVRRSEAVMALAKAKAN